MEVRKRKQRAILSCNDCRRRKLKCDRELPCNRCVSGGYPEKCTYNLPKYGQDSQPVKRVRTSLSAAERRHVDVDVDVDMDASVASSGRVEQLECQLAELQDVVRRLAGKSENAEEVLGDEEGAAPDEPDASGVSAGLFKGRGVRTFYYGPSSPITIVAHFPDLRPFMKHVFIGSTLQQLRQDSKAQEERAQAKQSANRVLTVPTMRSLLPDRGTVDKVLRTYFDTFETTYRILHAPTFWAAYANYWDGTHEPNSEMDAIVLAILACTLCTSTHETPRYNASGSSFRSKALVWLKACEAWLRRQSNKRRTLGSLQVRLLRLLALSTTCFKTKEYYHEVQAHVGFMISSGMHRDPRILGARCSMFEAEMRRRLWATSMELEMQASIDKGTPSTLSSLQHDCAAPRNINDADLHPDMRYFPDPHPYHTFTDTSYLHYSVRSLPLRAKILATANSLHPPPPFNDTLQQEQDVHDALSNLPQWKDPRALMASTLLDLELRQFLVILHAHWALNPESRMQSKSSYRYAIVTLLESCETLLSLHTALLDTHNFALCCLRFDYLRAALLICHIAYHASLAGDTFITRVARPIFEGTSNASLRLLEERSMRPGRGDHHYWYVSAAISLVSIQYLPIPHAPESRVFLEKQASERVCNLLYRVLALQDDEEEAQPAEVILGDVNAGAVGMDTPTSFVDPVVGSEEVAFPMATGALEGFGGQAAGAWMLDDLWFMGDFEGGMTQNF